MSILSATNLSQSFAFVDVFTGINLSVTHDAKIGLIGPNGVGKTSLLRIVCGMEQPVTGSVQLAKGKRLGYLPQEAYDAFHDSANSVWEEMLHVFDDLHTMEARMRELEVEMASPDSTQHDVLLHEYGDLQHEFEHRGGYDFENRIEQTLDGLGFNKSNRDTPVAHLSGGQKTRALLAKLLLQNPDLLVLDEPTNHLDVEAIEWLEKTMVAWDGALIICSHDRYFLDKVVNRIWEMSRTNIEVYRGNYSAYLQQRDERFERSVFVFSQEKARLEREVAYIKANAPPPDGPTPISVGKLKRLTRDVVTLEKYGVEVLMNEKWSEIAERLATDGGKPVPFGAEEAEKRVARLRPPSRPPKLNLHLQPHKRSGNVVLRTKGLVVGYGMTNDDAAQKPGRMTSEAPSLATRNSSLAPLFECDDLELRWRERVALIGPNGSGKTTFLKTALSSRTLHDDPLDVGLHAVPGLPPLAGSVEVGSSLRVGYFAQAHDELDANGTIRAEIERHAEAAKRPMFQEGDMRYFLAQFLFTDDDVFKPISGLSGGERARLALAILSLQGANFLVLDEPTNHLDIATQEVLEQVLGQFDGTILMVSHDRYLIDKLAEQVWFIADERLRVFKGNYREFAIEREKGKSAQSGGRRQKENAANPSPVPTPKKGGEKVAPQSPISNLQSPATSKNQDKRRAEKLSQVEAQISDLEAHLSAINKDLEAAGVQNQSGKVRELSADYAATQRALDALLKEWEALSQ
jgi:ATP-binding cassette subfamily F protein 3